MAWPCSHRCAQYRPRYGLEDGDQGELLIEDQGELLSMSGLPQTKPKEMLAALNPKDDGFAVDAVNMVLSQALHCSASDVHVQPREGGWEVLYRIDGVLSLAGFLAGGGAGDPVARLMVLAGLPTYQSGTPMEGRLVWEGKQQADDERGGVAMRLGVFPTVHGPRGVVRILQVEGSHQRISLLGLDHHQEQVLAALCDQTSGLVLVSGPAGSGKTTTMYALLREIAANVPRRSVMTIEDPVETVVDSISQSELAPVTGLTLASALKSAVRQDSEVLLVSEIRDPDTAEAAVQASLTGHLIFSSLHSTDVASALRRLTQLGVPHHLVRSGVRAVINQRLLRKICESCRQGSGSTVASHAAQVSNPAATLTGQAEACPACAGTGYKGRFAIAQVVRFDSSDAVGEALADTLQAGDSVQRMRAAARERGAVDLHDIADAYIERGITDDAEVYRVLGKRADG